MCQFFLHVLVFFINGITYQYGGVKVIVTVGTDVTTFIVENGEQGPKGDNGEDGEDGVCTTCCSDGVVCIKHIIQNANDPWFNHPDAVLEGNGNSGYIILTQTLSEFVYHTYEIHGGSATQGAADSWYDCDNLED